MKIENASVYKSILCCVCKICNFGMYYSYSKLVMECRTKIMKSIVLLLLNRLTVLTTFIVRKTRLMIMLTICSISSRTMTTYSKLFGVFKANGRKEILAF